MSNLKIRVKRLILATSTLLLIAGCQPKHDTNDAGTKSKPTVGPDSSSHVEETTKADHSSSVEKMTTTDDSAALGNRVFASCARCHQLDGTGVPGKYPPLDGNPLVNGRADIVTRIVLDGLHGPIEVNGKTFNSQMPSWSRFDDRSLAAVLTHIRGSWSNHSPSVSEAFVATVRKAVGGRTVGDRTEAWTMAALESTPVIEAAK